MKVPTKVKIIKAGLDSYWYANKVGEVLEVKEFDSLNYLVLSSCAPEFDCTKYYIDKEDCEIVKDTPEFDMKKEKWFIRTPTPKISELVQEWLFEQGLTWCNGDKRVDADATAQHILSNIAEWEVEGVNLNGFMFSQYPPDAPYDSCEIKLSFKTIIDSVEYPVVETEQDKAIRELEETIAKAAEQIKQLKGEK